MNAELIYRIFGVVAVIFIFIQVRSGYKKRQEIKRIEKEIQNVREQRTYRK
ncbi:MAG: hypothetical protein ACQEQD_06725 [Bacillota bacterium]